MSSEDQLVSFFLYSFFIYPITGYLVSSHRKYPRWHGAVYAVLFLLAIALFHMYYEHIEKGQNYYQMLNVTRNTSTNLLKKAYKQLSLQLHPDKNKSPNASEEFRAIKQAFEVLNNPDTRRAYSLLGDTGVKIASKGLIDTKYIVLQMIVYYGSTMIFTFLMTFSEPTGDALITSIFGLLAMMFIESLLILEEWNLPSWFMPYYTSHNIVTFLHRTDRLDGLYSTVVCDELGVCLGLVYSNKESIQLALLDRKGIYWSRSRNSLWRKGESSGMIQDLVSVRCDCDRDALKFTVIQKGDPPAFCHLMTRSCWGESSGFQHLQATLTDRKKSAPIGSYTKRLFDDPALLKMKLLEEVQELVEAVEPDHIAAEAADVMYFLMTRCVAAGVELSDIQRHLDKRALKVTRRPGNAKEWRNQQAQEILQSKDNTSK
eukprot:gene18450-24157_t